MSVQITAPDSCRQLCAASCHFNAKRQHGADNKPEGGGLERLALSGTGKMHGGETQTVKTHSNDFLDCLLERGH